MAASAAIGEMFKSQFRKAQQLITIAHASKKDLQVFRSFHVAAIFRKKLISIGFNTNKGDPKGADFYPWTNYGAHAEFRAIQRAKGRDLTNTELYILRLDNNGRLNNSYPCQYCLNYLRNIGFKRIFYTTFEGAWKQL